MYTVQKADFQKHYSFIVDAQQMMAKETEGLELDSNVLNSGVKGLFDRPEFGQYYVALKDDTPVASTLITYEWSDWRDGIVWWIQSVYVLPDYRGQGVFKAIYENLKNEVEVSSDLKGLRLYVEQENKNAQRVYEKLGMSKDHYFMYEFLK